MSRKKNKYKEQKPVRLWWLLGFFLLVIIIGVVYWQRSNIAGFFVDTANGIFSTLGWGLILIILGLLVLTVIVLIKKVPGFLQTLHIISRFLGGVSLILAVWCILAFANKGGTFGQTLLGNNGFIGALRILGFIVLGLFLLAPVNSCRAVAWLFRRIFRREQVAASGPIPVSSTPVRTDKPTPTVYPAREKPAAKPTWYQRPFIRSTSPAPQQTQPAHPVQAVTQPVQAAIPVQTPPQSSPQELKQIAQDVWKKYGEASGLIVVDGWKLPPIDILERSPEVEYSPVDNTKRAKTIEEALSSYGVEAKVIEINPGPTVTQFGLEPGWYRRTKDIKEKDRNGNTQVRQEEVSRTRVKVERITSLANDLALSLAAPSIRIEAPVPGKGIVGIEVPNTVSTVVTLRGVVETTPFQKLIAKSKMAIALGEGAGGEAVAADLTKMPHLLIAGATGSGKTVCLNAIVCSLLLHNTPNELMFIMVDPKRVELTPFNSIPHLAAPVIVETEKALTTLRWLSQEMDRRYKVMAEANVRNIEGYNKNRKGTERMPFLVLIIDELADLMMTGNSTEVEHNLCRLAQLARATGIHLVVATQRPSVDVITGLIKANFPTRISFAVTSQVDSRTILDSVGAEKLLGRGDMLYMPTDSDRPKRLQGCYVSDAETERLVYFWNSQNKDQQKPSLLIEEIAVATGKKEEPADVLLEEARQLAEEHGHISASFLQRRLRIGYPRAARIMEQLEAEGFDGDDDGEEAKQ